MSGEFANPVAGGPPPAGPKKRSLTTLWIILAAVLGAGVVILFLALTGAGGTPGADGPSASPVPGAAADAPSQAPEPTESPTTEPTTESTTAPPDAGVVFPAACEPLFDQGMLDQMPHFVINPAWTQDPGLPPKYGSSDDVLKHLIADNTHLTCVFGGELGGSEAGITTNVVQVDEGTAETIATQLEYLGQDCFAELDGLRCVMESRRQEGYWGESHFLRDDIWLATLYANMGPDGYTHHIVGNIWD